MRVQWLRSRVRRRARVWSIPVAYIFGAIAAGLLMPRLDQFLLVEASFFSPSTAVSLLSAIASGMLTFTGFVFSMSFLMIQFGSSAYSPRLTRYFLEDRVFRHALGMFTATFIYGLLALIVVGLPGAVVVSDLTVIAAILGVFGSVFLFLALIQRVGWLQITNVLYMIGNKGRETIHKQYPVPYFSAPAKNGEAAVERQPYSDETAHIIANLPEITQEVHYSGPPMTILQVDVELLVKQAAGAGAVIKVDYWVGDTILDGATLLEVRGGRKRINEAQVSAAFEMGVERTIEKDSKYAIRLIVDIAIRALSRAINDPTTAVQALDQLEDMLLWLGTHLLDVGYAYGKSGALRVIYPTTTWEDYLDLCLHEIRIFGAGQIQVARRLHALLEDLETAVPEPRKALVQEHMERLEASISRSIRDVDDRLDALQSDHQGIGLSSRE